MQKLLRARFAPRWVPDPGILQPANVATETNQSAGTRFKFSHRVPMKQTAPAKAQTWAFVRPRLPPANRRPLCGLVKSIMTHL